MSAEISIYESTWNNDKGETVLVDTKSCYIQGKESCETEVYRHTNQEDAEWELLNVYFHDNVPESRLKAAHDKIVAKWSNQ